MDEHIRTFKMRRGRVTPGQAAALASTTVPSVDDLDAGSIAGAVVEIGFGFGEATVGLASVQPQVKVVAVDVHTPGIGALLRSVADHGLDHVTVAEGDAMCLMRRLPPATLAGIRAFFPDPWPKARHHKRRLVSEATLPLFADVVRHGGFLHVATDWLPYAEAITEAITASSQWAIGAHPWADPKERPQTRFERRGQRAGRAITDVVAVRQPT